MAGVREGLRWLLAPNEDLVVVGEAGSVAEARVAEGDVLVCALEFPDGTAEDLVGARRPVVAYTFLPPDERGPAPEGVTALLRSGELRAGLPAAIRAAAGRPRGG